MNTRRYRLIFNKARGQLMAVAEIVTSQGKSTGETSAPKAERVTARQSLVLDLKGLIFGLWSIFGLVVAPVSQAQIIAAGSAPANQQPTVLNTGNGLIQVNIQTPSAAGVSRNTYSQFDVPQQGAILNNSRTNVQTQLGGWVQGNPWLSAGSAKVILNEVVSSNPSALNGYIEVAGQRADVVIANPNGINVGGGGFINASRVTLTTGTPNFNSAGGIDSYGVRQGQVTINGAGLDTSSADYTDLIARSVQVNAGIWAKNLKVTAGANQVSAANTTVQPLADASAPSPVFAIDVAQLGGMYAGSIWLVGTESGVGVRNLGTLGASAGNVVISANGHLENAGQINSTGQTRIDTSGGIQNSGTIYARDNASVTTRGSIDNSGTLAAQGDATLIASGQASQIHNSSGALIAAGVKLDGTLADSGSLSLSATEGLSNDGQLLAKDHLGTQSKTFTNTSAVIADSLSISATDSIVNSGPKALLGATGATGKLELLAPVIENRDDVTATDTAPQTMILGLGDVILAGGKDANGAYTTATRVLNQSGLIQSGQDLTVSADTLTNTRRQLTANSNFVLTSVTSGTERWSESNPDVPGGRYNEPPHEGANNSLYYDTSYTIWLARNAVDKISPEAQILANGNFTPSVAKLQNYWSKVSAGGDIALNGVMLDQDSWRGAQSLQERKESSGTFNYKTYKLNPWVISWNIKATYSEVPTYDSSFTANGSIAGSGNVINNPASSTPAILPWTYASQGSSAGTGPALNLPTSNLYRINTAPQSNYLVESNPLFANKNLWMGSDAYLGQFSYDPATMQKRLGDNYYEQQLVRDQVLALSGKTVAEGYANAQAQFEQMYAQGAAVAKSLNLTLGASLSADQVAALTSNVVIMETREIASPNGPQQVLVPVVYMAHVKPDDLLANGPLIAGGNINLTNTKGLTNHGAIVAQNNLTLEMGQDAVLNNRGGALQAGQGMKLSTVNTDIDLTSASVKAAQLEILSGKDLILSTASQDRTEKTQFGTRTHTDLGRLASIDVSGNAAISTVGDVTQNGGLIKVGGNLTADIGGSYNLGTVALTDHQVADYSLSKTTVHSDINHVRNLTSGIQVGGNATIRAGQDISTQGAYLSTDTGTLSLSAGRDIKLAAAQDIWQSDVSYQYSRSNGFSSSSTSVWDKQNRTTAVGTMLSGNTVNLSANRDVNVTGSNVVSTAGTTVNAGRDVTIEAATQLNQNSHRSVEKKSGLMGSGGIGFTIGSMEMSLDQQGTGTLAAASTLGSVLGDVTITAGHNATVKGSDVVAGGNIDVTAQNISIEAVDERYQRDEKHEFKQTGITVALSGVVGNVANSAVQIAQEAKNAGDGRIAALQGVKAGLTGYQAYQAYQQEAIKPADQQSFVGISISLSSQQSESQSSLKQSNSKGSTLTAGQNVTLTATGSGVKDADGYAADGNIGIAGSSIKGQNVTLDAASDIALEATRNTSEQTGSNSSSGWNVGASLGFGKGGGVTVFANVNKAKGHENGDGNFWNEATITAGQTLTVQSGRDTTLTGAQASGDTVLADVGRNLTLTSLQDHDHYDSQQTSASAGGSLTFGSMNGSGYFNVSRDKLRSDFDSVQQQTGLYAGKGGFDVYVGEHTQLNSAVIASTADADKNSLSTGTLGFNNLRNVADFEVKHESIGMSAGGSFAQSATTTLISQGASTVLGGGNSSGHAESTTYAAVSAGTLEVRDKDQQQQDVATLSRDTEHSANGLSPIFDKQKELDRLKESQLIGEIGAQATQIVITQMSMPVREKEAEAAKAEKAGDTVGAARLKEEAAALDKEIQAKWGMGSDFQRAAQAVTAALQGLSGGNMGAAISGAAAPYLAGIVKQMTDGSPTANLMAHAVLGAALAQASGGNAAAGAAGGAIAPIAAKLITDALYPGRDVSTLTETEKQNVSALTTLAGGLAGTVAGDALTGAQTAKNEVENNYLSKKQIQAKEAAIKNAKTDERKQKIRAMYDKLDAQQQQAAVQAIKSNELGVMTTVEYLQVKTDLQNILKDPSCIGMCQVDAQSSIKKIDDILIWYKMDQGNKPLFEFLDSVNTAFAIADLPSLFYSLTKLAASGMVKGTSVLSKVADGLLPEAEFAGRIPVRQDLVEHLSVATRSNKQITGGHNSENFFIELLNNGGEVIGKKQVSPGIYEVEYAILGKNYPGGYPKKTIYDPRIYSDKMIADMAYEAASRGMIKYQITGETTQYIQVGGLTFEVPIKITHGKAAEIRTVFPTARK